MTLTEIHAKGADTLPERTNPLASESVNSLLIRFAVPSIIAMLVSALYNMVDQFFIGHSVGMLGNAAPAADLAAAALGITFIVREFGRLKLLTA